MAEINEITVTGGVDLKVWHTPFHPGFSMVITVDKDLLNINTQQEGSSFCQNRPAFSKACATASLEAEVAGGST